MDWTTWGKSQAQGTTNCSSYQGSSMPQSDLVDLASRRRIPLRWQSLGMIWLMWTWAMSQNVRLGSVHWTHLRSIAAMHTHDPYISKDMTSYPWSSLDPYPRMTSRTHTMLIPGKLNYIVYRIPSQQVLLYGTHLFHAIRITAERPILIFF